MKQLLSTALAPVLALGLSTAAPAESGRYNGYQIPDYTVLARQGAIELRDYAPHVVAEIETEGSRRKGASRGFRALAGYIFGANAASRKIAMTAPVTQVDQAQAGDRGRWAVRFMMPSPYALDTLPTPQNAAVRLTEINPGKRLVIRFAGRALTGSLAGYVAQLHTYAAINGLELIGPMEIAYYDDPLTLPWKRRNEISFGVK